MIVNAPIVKIGGRKISVYSIDYSNGGSGGASSLALKYVNRSGRYSEPDLSSQDLVKISIGDFFKFNGYAVSYEKDITDKGTILTVKYIDDSIILDSCFVGLRGVHGPGFGPLEKRGAGAILGGVAESVR